VSFARNEPPFGAIFDWDGGIIDSGKLHERSWQKLASEIGKTIAPQSFLRGFGRKTEYIIPEIHGWTRDATEINRLSDRKEELYRELVRDSAIAPLPGVETWLRALKKSGVPCVVASSTHRANIDTILDRLGLQEAFDAVVSAEDVTHGKPNPEVFLVAAQRIGVPPVRCVVFEDAHVGIEAAHAGEMRAVAVTTTHSAEDLAAADLVVKRLDELTIEKVVALLPPSSLGELSR